MKSDFLYLVNKNHITLKQCLNFKIHGLGQHFVDGKTGIKDFDIWYFYEESPEIKFPYRWRKSIDSKCKKFGIHPDDAEKGYEGRRIDLLGRSIPVQERDPKRVLSKYLTEARTKTAKELSQKPVIALWPEKILGKIIWPS